MAGVDRDGRLVGRDAALGIAGAALDDALAGAGQLLLVTGEPGIGKSALLAEVARGAARPGRPGAAGRLLGRCRRAAVLALDPGAARDRHRTEPSNSARRAGCCPGRQRRDAGSAQEAADARFRLFDAVARALGGWPAPHR